MALAECAWGPAAGSGAALPWRAPTQLTLPVVRVLDDGTYLSVLIDPKSQGARRARIVQAAGQGREIDPEQAHLVRVVEYDVPDRAGNGTGELVVLLTTITEIGDARADELTAAYHQRWEEGTANDQLKTHLRGPEGIPRSRLPDLVHQETWARPIVHYALGVLIARVAEAADLDPDQTNYSRVLCLVRRTATGPADFPAQDWTDVLPDLFAEITRKTLPARRPRTSARAIKRARHNNYRVKKSTGPTARETPAQRPSDSTPPPPRSRTKLKLRGIEPRRHVNQSGNAPVNSTDPLSFPRNLHSDRPTQARYEPLSQIQDRLYPLVLIPRYIDVVLHSATLLHAHPSSR